MKFKEEIRKLEDGKTGVCTIIETWQKIRYRPYLIDFTGASYKQVSYERKGCQINKREQERDNINTLFPVGHCTHSNTNILK